MRGETAFASPIITGAPRIQVLKLIKESGGGATLITFKVLDTKQWDNPKGLFIKLDNGSILRFENSLIRVKQETSDSWTYTGILTLDKSLFKQFSNYKIINFVLENGDNLVSPEWGEQIKNWITCVYNSK